MCGFVGFTGTIANREAVLEAMMDRIVHRGPDMGGQFFTPTVALGFRRLSILDLTEAGAQPMSNEAGDVTIVFNGEIYNFQQLRVELEAAGYQFHCGADTESLLHGYELWGESVVDHLRGMYAFVICDTRDPEHPKLFGARDIFGIKPFFYNVTPTGDLIFGSEIKSFLEHPDFIKEVNPDALKSYMTFQCSYTDETFFKGVFKLPAAHCFTWQDGRMDIRRYWECEFNPTQGTFDEYVEACDAVVHESVAAHKIADVKVGSFLSGGVDSSYITACLMPDNTFSVGFETPDGVKFDETNYAARLSEKLGVKNFRRIVSAQECFDMLPTIQYHMDEPQSNLSSIPLYFLAQMASEQVTVVLSGEGADELFAGYEWYEDTPEVRSFKKWVPRPIRKALGNAVAGMKPFKGRSFLLRSSETPEHYYVGQAFIFSPDEADEVLKPAYRQGKDAFQICADSYATIKTDDELTKKQCLDMNLWLPGDILQKADKMCMAHSLELRVPFLDRKVMDFAESIPTQFRCNEQGNKQVLRHAANRVLPDEWATRPKVGFPVPMVYWLREERFYNYVKEYFQAPWAAEFFDTDKLMQLLDDHYAGRAKNQRKIYTSLTFLIWYKRFFIDETGPRVAA